MKVEKLSKCCLVLIQKKKKDAKWVAGINLNWLQMKKKNQLNLNANIMETYFTPYSRNSHPSHLVRREKFQVQGKVRIFFFCYLNFRDKNPFVICAFQLHHGPLQHTKWFGFSSKYLQKKFLSAWVDLFSNYD